MAAEVGSLVLFPTPIFLYSVQIFTAERPWFLTYCLLMNNLIRLTSSSGIQNYHSR